MEVKKELILDHSDLELIEKIKKKRGIGDYGSLLWIIERLGKRVLELYTENLELKMKFELQNGNSDYIDSKGFPGDD